MKTKFDKKYPEGKRAKTKESLVYGDPAFCLMCGDPTCWRDSGTGAYLCSEECYARHEEMARNFPEGDDD